MASIRIEELLNGRTINAPVHVEKGKQITLQPHIAPAVKKEEKEAPEQSTLNDLRIYS